MLHGIIVLDLLCFDGNYDLWYHNYVHDDGIYYDHENLELGKNSWGFDDIVWLFKTMFEYLLQKKVLTMSEGLEGMSTWRIHIDMDAIDKFW